MKNHNKETMKVELLQKFGTLSSLVAICSVLGLLAPIQADGAPKGKSPLLPPQANFRGISFEEWNFLTTEWVIATGLGGQDLPNTVKKVRFLAGEFAPGTFEFDVQVRPGTAFVFPAFFVFGELYEDGTFDDPEELADLLDEIKATADIELIVDGKLVLSGTAAELSDYAYGLTYFDEPIYFIEPQDRGGINSIAAAWTFGVGAVFHPLPVGQHTIQAKVNSAFFGSFDYTYRITVTP